MIITRTRAGYSYARDYKQALTKIKQGAIMNNIDLASLVISILFPIVLVLVLSLFGLGGLILEIVDWLT